MNLELRLLAAWAALILPSQSWGASSLLIDLSERPSAESNSAVVSFRVPPYTLTNAEREIVAACLVLEAANQGDFGMRSVMSVIRNRSRERPELFASTVLREKQFSAFNRVTAGRESLARAIHRAQRDRTWRTAVAIVDEATGDDWHDPTEGATHYTRVGERTRWSGRLAKTVTIGSHSFYR